MSESALSQSVEQLEVTLDSPQRGDFNYQPVPPLAPAAMVLGICSAIGLISEFALIFGIIGTILGAVCIVRIRRARGELGGKWLALSGFALSFLFLASGSTLHAYNFATEVPEGHRRVNFYSDISQKGLVVEDGTTQLHPDIRALDGQKIFLKGYMYPTRQTEGLTAFLLVKDSEKCCFGGQPEISDMIGVRMDEGLSVNFRAGLVSVGGVFRVRDSRSADPLDPLFELEGTYFSRARTSF